MTYAMNGPDWVELQPDRDVVIGDAVCSYETVTIWSPQQRTAKGIKPIVEDPIPEGRVTGSTLVDDDGKPRRVWRVEPLTLAERKAELVSSIANKRWQAETSSIAVGGVQVSTDRDSQGMVDRIVKAFDDGDIEGSVRFKASSGWVEITHAQARAIKAAGAQHIQACFDREYVLSEAIAAALDESALDVIDINAGWPT